MEWKDIDKDYSIAEVEPGGSVAEAMTDFCMHIKERVIPQNENEGLHWDCLSVELWPDSGRMIAFPSLTSTRERIEKAACQVMFGDLLAKFDELGNLGLEDKAFEAAVLREIRVWIDKFLDAAGKVNLTGHIRFFEFDEDSPLHEERL